MDTFPLVSVIVPCYNGAPFLNQALDSILAQTYRPLEILMIDDGSTDRSAAIAQAYPEVHYAYQEHAGLAAALNQGVALARGDFFSFLDADDVWLETKLEQQMAAFDEDAALDIAFGHLTQFNESQNTRTPPEPGIFKGTMMVRRASFFQVGLFATEYRVGDFIDWFLRAHEMGLKHKMLPTVLLRRRVHDNNMSVRERDHRKAYLQILKKSLERRQKSNP